MNYAVDRTVSAFKIFVKLSSKKQELPMIAILVSKFRGNSHLYKGSYISSRFPFGLVVSEIFL